jgi:hypothetical protein
MAAERHNLTRRSVLGAGAAATVVAVSGAGATTTGSSGETPAPGAAAPPLLVRHRSSRRIDIICRDCGGNNVCRDAWAVWEIDEQDWVLGAVFDDGHCDDCQCSARLEEVELPPQSSPTG